MTGRISSCSPCYYKINDGMLTSKENLCFDLFASSASACDPQCAGGGQGTCRSDGRCFCWWGWTGPNAVYITSGLNKNRIVVITVYLFREVIKTTILEQDPSNHRDK